MSLLARWRAWRNRPRVVTGDGRAVYIGNRTLPWRWEPELPPSGTFVISTQMVDDFDPPSADARGPRP